MKIQTLTAQANTIPYPLLNIASPPKQLFVYGDLSPLLAQPRLAVVGSRKVSLYGRSITKQLAGEAARQGIAIVSGLALGVDAIAHKAALDAGGKTIAILPSGLDIIYPQTHFHLAKEIVDKGGVLISEYPAGTAPFKQNFIARNRLVSGLSDAVLITEAAEKSGTLHTANFALEQGRTVMAVPGNINSLLSKGTNNLIKAGALPVTESNDILLALGLDERSTKAEDIIGSTEAETTILQLLVNGVNDASELQLLSKLEPSAFTKV